jgi:hypothetical protein
MECEIKGDNRLKSIGKKLEGSRHMVRDISEVVNKENLVNSGVDIYNFF